MLGPLECFNGIWEWAHSREWDFYRFSSPLIALAVQFGSRPFKKNLAAQHDQRLSDAGITDSAERALFLRIAKDWDLRVSYFATAITTFFSLAAITHVFSGGSAVIFAITIGILFILAVIIYPKIFQNQLGRISTPLTQPGAKTRFQKWLYKKKWTEADFYSYALRFVNVVLMLLILITMPAQSTSQPNQ